MSALLRSRAVPLFAAAAAATAAGASSGAFAPVYADDQASASQSQSQQPPNVHKLPIYSQPAPPVTLVETHTALERHVGDARRAVVGTAYQAQQTVQGLVERWIGVERAVERKVTSLVPANENMTPGLLYVGVATLAGSVFTRYRAFPLRLLTPPLAFVASLNYFLPQTAANVGAFYRDVEAAHAPAVREQRENLVRYTRGMANKVRGIAEEAKSEAEGKWEEGLQGVEKYSGLKVAGKTPGQVVEEAKRAI